MSVYRYSILSWGKSLGKNKQIFKSALLRLQRQLMRVLVLIIDVHYIHRWINGHSVKCTVESMGKSSCCQQESLFAFDKLSIAIMIVLLAQSHRKHIWIAVAEPRRRKAKQDGKEAAGKGVGEWTKCQSRTQTGFEAVHNSKGLGKDHHNHKLIYGPLFPPNTATHSSEAQKNACM